MIGFYIHHHGRGHVTRARAIADALGESVTGLSSLPRPEDWPGEWVVLPLDEGEPERDARARGRLHWVPLGSAGLRERSAAISAWIAASRPRVLVVDVSVEVSLLARLHGIPVVTFALPGDRTDAAHRLGFDIAAEILATWPQGVEGMDLGLPAETRRRVTAVGAIGRFAPADGGQAADGDSGGNGTANGNGNGTPHALILGGGEHDTFSSDAIAALDSAGWSWMRVGGGAGWVDDLWPHLRAADLVVTHAGDGALADVSAARRPAIVIPQERPHREQRATARVLRSGLWPAVVVDRTGRRDWAPLLERARALDGGGWTWWNDGEGARRAADVIRRAATAAA